MCFTLWVISWLEKNKKMPPVFLNSHCRHVHLAWGHLSIKLMTARNYRAASSCLASVPELNWFCWLTSTSRPQPWYPLLIQLEEKAQSYLEAARSDKNDCSYIICFSSYTGVVFLQKWDPSKKFFFWKWSEGFLCISYVPIFLKYAFFLFLGPTAYWADWIVIYKSMQLTHYNYRRI